MPRVGERGVTFKPDTTKSRRLVLTPYPASRPRGRRGEWGVHGIDGTD